MAGIINSNMGGTTEKPMLDPNKMLEVNPVGVDPERRTVDDNELVAGQMKTLLDKESPYITRARTSAAQVANSRGLLNSSMAAGAGEAAAIDAVLPIATADAGTHNLAKRENQAAGNSALQFNATETNAAAKVNADAANQASRMKLGAELEKGLLEKRGELDISLQTLKGTQAKDLANIEANYKGLIQASAAASSVYSEMVRAIGGIMADPLTSAEQKQAAVNTQVQLLKSGLAVIGAAANIDLKGLLDFTPNASPTAPGTPPGAAPAPAPAAAPAPAPAASSAPASEDQITSIASAPWVKKTYNNGQHSYWENLYTGQVSYQSERPTVFRFPEQQFQSGD